MQKILVTGADGFIGSHLTEMLLEEGYQVRALALYNSFNNWGWLEGINHPQLEVVTGDVRDSDLCDRITVGVDVVFHLAALIAIPYSYIVPESYIETNVKGTLNICRASKKNGVEKVLITSTSEVYGTAQYVPIDEEHPKQPQSPYSATKISADAIALSFYNSFGLPVIIVRPFNTFGPRQSARAVIPAIITQIISGKKEISLGDTRPTRDFVYVKDTCRGFLKLADCEAAIGQEVNIATRTEVSIRETFKVISEITNSKAIIKENTDILRPEKSEVFRLCGDNTKLKSLTGFVPVFALEEGLNETIKWFSNIENMNKYKVSIHNV